MADHDTMRALSVRQPWAAAIAHLGKDVENRTRATSHRGLVAIHAAKADVDDPDYALDLIGDIAGCSFRDVLAHDVRGHIVAVADLTGCHQCSAGPVCSPWAQPGQWHWQLANIRPLPAPIPVQRGWLGLWHLPEDADAAVRRVLNLEEAAHG